MARPRTAVMVVAVVTLATSLLLAACGSGSGSDADTDASLSPAAARGKDVAKAQGCISCHTADGEDSIGPTWKDLAGSQVVLEGDKTVVADDAYLTRAILAPKAEVVEGYGTVMPPYEGEITQAEIDDLLAYFHALAPPRTGESSATSG